MRLLLTVSLFALFSSTLTAQEVLFAEHKGRMFPVLRASRERPLIRDKDKIVVPNGSKFVLQKTEEYLPVFISIRNVRVRTASMQLMTDARQLNNRFEFHARFASPYALEDVFVVLELFLEKDVKSLFIHEVGRLEPRKSRSLEIVVPLSAPLGEGKYKLHVFVGGRETLHSLQPFTHRERILDRMIAKRAATLKDGAPQLFVGPIPEYPKALLKTKAEGRAVVRARIRSTGAVVDPTVVSASAPAFGESALEAVRQWRFLPLVKDGHPTDTVAELPIQFDLPDEVEDK